MMPKRTFTVAELREIDPINRAIWHDYGENGRWYRGVCSVFPWAGTHFLLEWNEGLTESQDSSYPYDEWANPEDLVELDEVHEVKRMVEVIDWVPLEQSAVVRDHAGTDL